MNARLRRWPPRFGNLFVCTLGSFGRSACCCKKSLVCCALTNKVLVFLRRRVRFASDCSSEKAAVRSSLLGTAALNLVPAIAWFRPHPADNYLPHAGCHSP